MKPIATGYYVLIETNVIEKKSSGGIVLPTEYVQKEQGGCDRGIVRGFGPICFAGYNGIDDSLNAEERAAAWGVKIGDQVQFDRYDGKELELEGYENYRLIADAKIMATVGDDHE